VPLIARSSTPGRAQKYLLPEHVEKIASTYERFEDIPAYARCVSLEEISDAANDFNLNIRRYVDNSPPPEPHDVRAHLVGGVPVAEVEANRVVFEALGFEPSRAFAKRSGDTKYYDFGSALPDRKAISPLVEQDGGVSGQRSSKIIVRDLGFRWGSCGKNGALYFNWRLLQLPVRLIDYVILHEHIHLLHHNHSPDFWRGMDNVLPDWRDRKMELERDWGRFARFALATLPLEPNKKKIGSGAARSPSP
jgi:YgjP-like, metallopeptidase domain/N-6 DNA Methylase